MIVLTHRLRAPTPLPPLCRPDARTICGHSPRGTQPPLACCSMPQRVRPGRPTSCSRRRSGPVLTGSRRLSALLVVTNPASRGEKRRRLFGRARWRDVRTREGKRELISNPPTFPPLEVQERIDTPRPRIGKLTPASSPGMGCRVRGAQKDTARQRSSTHRHRQATNRKCKPLPTQHHPDNGKTCQQRGTPCRSVLRRGIWWGRRATLNRLNLHRLHQACYPARHHCRRPAPVGGFPWCSKHTPGKPSSHRAQPISAIVVTY